MLRIPALAAGGAAAGPASGRKPSRKSASSTARPAADLAANGAASKLRRGSTGETEGMGAAVAAGALGPHVVAKTWQQQVERVTAPMGSVAPSLQGKENRFRSTAVYCEVKLREMLHKGKKDQKGLATAEEPGAPDAYRTAVCCQLLSELCELGLPFAAVLTVIRDELVRAIYSDHFLSRDGSLTFDQVPFFVVVTRLEADKAEMAAERERWKAALLERQGDVGRIEQQMQALEAQVRATEGANAGLRAELQAGQEAFEGAKAEVRLTREEMKRLKKELLRAKEEVQRALAVEAECLAEREDFQRLRATQQQSVHELHRLQAHLETERREAADSVPKKELDAAQVALVDVQAKLAVALVAAKERRGELTPRPAWAKLRHGGAGARGATAEQAAELCALTERLGAEVDGLREESAQARVTLADLTERLREADCLAPPDVAVMPDAARSIEELPGVAGKDPDRFKVLGCGAELPRCLRAVGPAVHKIQLHEEVFLQTVADIWDSKAAFDAERATRSTMPEYLYAHVRRSVETHGAVVEWTYTMLHALHRLPRLPPPVDCFRAVLFGELSEAAYRDGCRMAAALAELLRTVARACSPTNHTKARTADCLEALDAFFPAKSADSRKALHKALRAHAKKEEVVIEDVLGSGLAPPGLLGLALEQHLAEVRDYTARLRAALDRLRTDAAEQNRTITLADVSTALERFDSSKAGPELEALLALGCGMVAAGEIPGMVAARVDVDVERFVERVLRTGLVKGSKSYDTSAILKWKVEGTLDEGALSDGGLPETA